MKIPLKMHYHIDLPNNFKLNQITISKIHNKYYISLGIAYEKDIFLMSKQDLDIKKVVGIDLNINEIALSNGEFIKTNSKLINKFNMIKPLSYFKKNKAGGF